MTNDNPCYRRGALWQTRTKLAAIADSLTNNVIVEIPRGETIMLLFYEMNISYEENIIFLWKDQVYYSSKVDTGFSFDLDPDGVNTKSHAKP